MINKFIRDIFYIVSIIFIILFFLIKKTDAAFLQFDPGLIKIQEKTPFSVKIIIDSEEELITSADVYIIFDTNVLKLENIVPGEYFPEIVTKNIENNKFYIAGLVSNPGEYKSGRGLLATLIFNPLNFSSTKVFFYCNKDSTYDSNINKNDINASDLINCDKNNYLTIEAFNQQNQFTNTTTLPRSGEFFLTKKIYLIGGILIFAGFLIRFFTLKYKNN